MSKNSTRVTAVVGTTMALVIAGTAAVAAAGPRDRDGRGFGGPGIEGKAGPAMGGMRGDLGAGLRGLDSDVERTERTVQTVDGTTTVRVEQGVVDGVAADSLSFTLASGEAVTVVIDEDTQAIAFEEQEVTSRRGWSRMRLAPTEIEATGIESGAEIVVWSDSEDGSDFVASRVAVQPAAAEAADADAATTDEADADAAVDEPTEEAGTTDA